MASKITCQEAVQMFFAYLDRALKGRRLEQLEAHLERCLDCCEKLTFQRQLSEFIKARLGPDGPPPGFEERLKQALAQRGR